MQTQDISQLKQALQCTFSPNQQVISQGEQFLNQSKQQPNYAITLLMIVDDASNELTLRQSALVNMKTFLEKSWRGKKNDPNAIEVSAYEKQAIRGAFLDAVVRCVTEKKLRSQYEDLMYKLVAIDYPQEWPDLVQNIVLRMQCTITTMIVLQELKSYEETWACLVCLRRVVENYQFMLDSDRAPLEPIVMMTFPILEQLTQKFLESYNEQTGVLIKTILKIFHHCMHMQLPVYLTDSNNMQRWLTFLKMLVDSKVAPELSGPTIDEGEMLRREKTYVWANKKWVGRIMVRVAQKFFNPKLVSREQVQYAQTLEQNYAVPFMESFYKIMAAAQTEFQAPRTCLFALKYLYYSLKLPTTHKLMIPHLETLLFDIALPAMQLTTRDDRIWKEDPDEYIRRLEDFSIASYNIKNAANDLLEQVCSCKDANGTSFLVHFLTYAQQTLASNTDVRNQQQLTVLKREAILWAIETQCKSILKIENVADSLESLLEKFIIPEFVSPIGFLRARACSLFAQYGTIEFKNRTNIQRAVEGIYKCILDKELPVRVSAAVSFSSILKHEEAKDLIRPGLSQVLETYIKLMDVIDNEGIVRSLEDIVHDFSVEIAPYAVQLTQHLSTLFLKYCNKQQSLGDGDDSDDDGETELAASGCLEAIKRILNSPLNDEAYTAMEPALFPIFNFCLTENGCDFISEALELLNLLLYKRKSGLTQGLWFYYPILVYVLIGLPQQLNIKTLVPGLQEEQYVLLEGCKKDWGSEFMRQMLGSLRNFIQKGGDFLLSNNDMFGNNLLSLIFKIIDKVYIISANGTDETDLNAVTTLLITLLENFRGKLDGTIPQILDLCLSNLSKPKTNRFKIVNLGVIYVSPRQRIQFNFLALEVVEILMGSPQTIYGNMLSTTLYIYININIKLYTLPNEQIPQYLLQNIGAVTKQLVEFTTRVLKAREEEESCEQEDQASVEEENEYQKTVDKLAKMTNGQADDDDEDEDDDEDFDGDEDEDYANLYESPLESIDEIILLEQMLINLQQTNPQLYQQMVGSLTPQEQETLTLNVKEAKVQYEEWLLSKQAK